MWILGLKGLSRQLYFQLISVLEFFFFLHTWHYVSKHHLNFMLVPEVQHCQSNCIKQFSWYLTILFHYRNGPIDNCWSRRMTLWECQSSNPLCIPLSRWLLLLGIPQNLTQQTIFQSVCLNLIQISWCNLNALKLIPTLKK